MAFRFQRERWKDAAMQRSPEQSGGFDSRQFGKVMRFLNDNERYTHTSLRGLLSEIAEYAQPSVNALVAMVPRRLVENQEEVFMKAMSVYVADSKVRGHKDKSGLQRRIKLYGENVQVLANSPELRKKNGEVPVGEEKTRSAIVLLETIGELAELSVLG